MAETIQNRIPEAPLTYSEEMQQLREKLNGKPYCKAVRNLLPTYTPWQIRNIINGRGEDPRVLQALRIHIRTQEMEQQALDSQLAERAERLGLKAA